MRLKTAEPSKGRNFNLYLNDELVGELKFLERDGMKSQTFEPLKTKYGIVRMVNKIKWTITDSKFSYDFYRRCFCWKYFS